MAIRKTVNLLPEQFRTDINEKFLNATLDQLITPGRLEVINGFVGRRDVVNFKASDSYLVESNANRTHYQLEPAVTIKNELDPTKYDFATTYLDIVNSIGHRGGDKSNHDKLFSSDYYVWSPHIDYDKIINYTKYYWLPTELDYVEIVDDIFNIDTVIETQSTYTSKNDNIVFTSGLKVRFTGSVTPTSFANKDYIIEGVGKAIILVEADNTNESLDKDYITISRGCLDENQWSKNNKWFHEDIITLTNTYNGTTTVLNALDKGKRPIIEFDRDLTLFNSGNKNIGSVDLIDTSTYTDVFSDIEGQPNITIDGVDLIDGQTVMFLADTDPLVYGKVYDVAIININSIDVVNLTQSQSITGFENNNIISIKAGTLENTQWYFKNNLWVQGQAKSLVNQNPLFDMFDDSGVSFGEYTSSDFTGTTIFNYIINKSTTVDKELGFGLTYKNFNNVGDIVFSDDLNVSSFNYVASGIATSKRLATGLLHTNNKDGGFMTLSNWSTGIDTSRQLIQQNYIVSNELSEFALPAIPKVESELRNVIIFVNKHFQNKGSNQAYILTDTHVIFNNQLEKGDNVIIKVYSGDKINPDATNLFYTTPINLNNNPLNELAITNTFTLGQVRSHVQSCAENNVHFIGDLLGSNNMRDIRNIESCGTTIIQNAAGLSKAGYMLNNNEYCLFRALDYVATSYDRFKKQLLNAAGDSAFNANTALWLDELLEDLFTNKNQSNPFFDSDMVPYSSDRKISKSIVVEPNNKAFELDTFYSDTAPSALAVLVFLNDSMLVKDRDYTFSKITSFIILTDNITLRINDVIRLVEFNTTDNNYVPTTPTKMGLYPATIPAIYEDDTYVTTRTVIKGHDGSITPAYGDFRDDILLEFETRIYNNLKVKFDEDLINLADIIPSRFNDTQYTMQEINSILASEFVKWSTANKVDYTSNTYFDVNDDFTWNYKVIKDGFDNPKQLQGYWRAIYRYYYGTDTPHITPWEMVGFGSIPLWWEDTYGKAPYTSGNLVLWEDMEAGVIASGDTAGTYIKYTRLGMISNYLPVDSVGALRSPSTVGITNGAATTLDGPFAFGDGGPSETAWRRSSFFPYAMQVLMAVTKPAKYFELMYDVSSLKRNSLGQLISSDTGFFKDPRAVKVNSYNGARTIGYNNFIVDQIKQVGAGYVGLYEDLTNIKLNLAYKLAGFSDKNKLQIILEQISPSKETNDIFIPTEDYNFHLLDSSPIDNINYSGIVVERTTSGYKVNGYNKSSPEFSIYPSLITANKRPITIGGYGVNFTDYELGTSYVKGNIIKLDDMYYAVTQPFIAGNEDRAIVLSSLPALPTSGGITVTNYLDFSTTPSFIEYGREFTSVQETYDFIIGYGRYLEGVGFEFDNITPGFDVVENWDTTAKEFLFWTTNKFAPGSMITLSAGGNCIKVNLDNAQVGSATCSFLPSGVLNQNKEQIAIADLFYKRIDNTFELRVNPDVDGIYSADINPIQTEHLLIIENETVFKDVIWSQFSGSRQNRIRLVGHKTELWDGTQQLPGYVLLDDTTDEWNINQSYVVGDVIKFKSKFYASKVSHTQQDLIEQSRFDYSKWKELDKVKSGLLGNMDSKADGFRGFYEVEEDGRENGTKTLASNLIGFQQRKYLNNLQIDTIAQTKFYQGFIKEKGTRAIIDRLLRAKLPAVNSELNMYEEWAFRVGAYGSVDSTQSVELHLNENEFTNNQEIIEVINNSEQYNPKHITHRQSDLWNAPNIPNSFDKNMFGLRENNFETRMSLPDAGYVNLDEVQHTVLHLNEWVPNYDIVIKDIINVDSSIIGKKTYTTESGIALSNGSVISFTDINVSPVKYKKDKWVVTGVDSAIILTEKQIYLNNINISDKIWVANNDNFLTNFDQNANDWNVYRINPSANNPIAVSRVENGNILVTFNKSVSNIKINNYVILRRFIDVINNNNYSGIFKVVNNLKDQKLNVLELHIEDTSILPYASLPVATELQARGEFLVLESARYATINDLTARRSPTFGWDNGDNTWIDDYDGSGQWAVLSKRNPYIISNTTYPVDRVASTGFGNDVISNDDTSTILIGSIFNAASQGSIEQWTREVPHVFDVESIFVGNADSRTNSVLSQTGHLLTITSDGLPQPALFGNFPNTATSNRILPQNFKHTITTRVGTNASTSINTTVSPDSMVGIAANGVPIYTSSIKANIKNDNGLAQGIVPDNLTWDAVGVRVELGLDNADGRPSNDGEYRYYSGSFLSQWNYNTYSVNSYFQNSNFNGNHFRHANGHSKIIGYALDGYPIYGPFAYRNVDDSTSQVHRMTSSYHKYTSQIQSREYTYTDYNNGVFIEDYHFVDKTGSLDKHNGRYCITPEYPEGTYAYFLTINSLGTPIYPYVVGPTFKQHAILIDDPIPSESSLINTNTTVSDSASNYTYLNTLVDGSLIDGAGHVGWIFSGSKGRKYIITGAPSSNNGRGIALIFKEQLDGSYLIADVITSPNPINNGQFGINCAISADGEWILVGAHKEDNAHVFKLVKGIFNDHEDIVSNGSDSIYPTRIVYSADKEINVTVNGQIKIPDVDYVLNNSNNTITFTIPPLNEMTILLTRSDYWTWSSTLQDGIDIDFGRGVAISDDARTFYVGAPLAEQHGSGLFDTGQVSIWTRTSTDVFSKIQNINISSDALLGSGFNFGMEIEAANDGHVIAVGVPSADISTDSGLLDNKGEVELFIDVGKENGIIECQIENPKTTENNTININNTEVVFVNNSGSNITIKNIIDSINNAEIPLVTASNVDNKLVITSTNTTLHNKLTVRPGEVNGSTVFNDIGITLYEYHSVIRHPDSVQFAYYGEYIEFNDDGTNILISSPTSHSNVESLFDTNLTTFDGYNIRFNELSLSSGSALLFTLNDDLTHSLIQRLDFPDRNFNDQFGRGICLTGTQVLVGAPGSEYENTELFEGTGTQTTYRITGQFPTSNLYITIDGTQQSTPTYISDNASPNSLVTFLIAPQDFASISIKSSISNTGAVYLLENPSNDPAWRVIKQEEPTIDIDMINKAFTYNKESNTLLDYVDFIDPLSGKISGIADQELSYKTLYDPAIYNITTQLNVTIDVDAPWGPNEVGTLWWDLTNTKYTNYHQGTIEHKRLNWGKLFPGTRIAVYEWVESDALPSEYSSVGGSGTPKFSNDSSYVTFQKYNPITNTEEQIYYYWVKDKTSIPETSTTYLNEANQIKFASHGNAIKLKSFTPASTRKLPVATVASIIKDPSANGLKYIGIIEQNAIVAFNLQAGLSTDNVILHINYDTVKNDIPLYTEWQLIQDGNESSIPNSYLIKKLGDSLAGIDADGKYVPDINVPISRQYGILDDPRQSMFVNRLDATKIMVNYCNDIFSRSRIALEKSLITLSAEDPIPTNFNETVNTYTELSYINTNTIDDGYSVIVLSDETHGEYWARYIWNNSKVRWDLNYVQSYDTTKFWDYIDWYDIGYDSSISIDHTIQTVNDLDIISSKYGNIIKVSENSAGNWALYINNGTASVPDYVLIAEQNATIFFRESLYTITTPLNEMRFIVDALVNDIFTSELSIMFNNMWFIIMRHVLHEQLWTDWIFKTSFVNVTQTVRGLNQLVNYVYNVEDNIRDYISEAKPYHTKIREYVFRYVATDPIDIGVSDFDLPGFYDASSKTFRSPNVYKSSDDDRIQLAQWINWYDNYQKHIKSFTVVNGGSMYPSYVGDVYDAVSYDTESFDSAKDIFIPPPVKIESGAQWLHGWSYVGESGSSINKGIGTFIVPNTITPELLWYYGIRDIDMGWKITIADALATSETKTFVITVVKDDAQLLNFYIDGVKHPTITIHKGSTYKFDQTNSSNINHKLQLSAIEDGTHRDGSGAAGTVAIDNGVITNVTVTNQGSGYVTTPVVTIESESGSGSVIYANLDNIKVRDIKEIIKFDRIKCDTTYTQYNKLEPNQGAPILVINDEPTREELTADSTKTEYPTTIEYDMDSEISVTVDGQIKILDEDYVLDNAKNIITFITNPARIIKGIITPKKTPLDITIPAKSAPVSGVTIVLTRGDYLTEEKDQLDRLTLYYAGGQLGNNSNKNWKGDIITDIPTYDAVLDSYGCRYRGSRVEGPSFDLNPGYGISAYDGIQYDEFDIGAEGIPIVGGIDTILGGGDFSASGGIDPAEVIIDGDGFVSELTSHAPEEQIPGIMFDALSIKVEEKLETNGIRIGFRIWQDMLGDINYYRISSAYTTTLSTNLKITDQQISVTDATKLFSPQPTTNLPGVIFINGERIEYYEITGNILKRIRRGTYGTGAATLHVSGDKVTDISSLQLIPGGKTTHDNIWYDTGVDSATNGLGLASATSTQVTFLNAYPL